MRFAFILTDLSGGGAEKAILNIASQLSANNHSVDIILLRNKIEYAINESFNLNVLSEHPSFGFFGKRILAYKLSSLIKKISKKTPYDVIVSTLPLADEVAIMAKLPNHWCRIANTLSAEVKNLAKISRTKSERRYKRYKNRYNRQQLIAVSKGVKVDLQESFQMTTTDIRVIYNPFDFPNIKKLSQAATDLPQQPYIIHVGRFSPQKRHDLLLSAFSKIKSTHLLVLLVNDSNELKKLITKNGLENKVVIAGFQKNPYPWVAAADLLVLSSDHEGMPNVLIESLAVGTPIVSTDCPSGPAELLAQQHPKCLVPPDNSAALTQSIDWALEHKPKMNNIDLSIYEAEQSVREYENLIKAAN